MHCAKLLFFAQLTLYNINVLYKRYILFLALQPNKMQDEYRHLSFGLSFITMLLSLLHCVTFFCVVPQMRTDRKLNGRL
jgi:hypothetical protein